MAIGMSPTKSPEEEEISFVENVEFGHDITQDYLGGARSLPSRRSICSIRTTSSGRKYHTQQRYRIKMHGIARLQL